MDGHIEWTGGLLRTEVPYGGRFAWGAFLRCLSPDEVEVCGIDRSPTTRDWRNARSILTRHGMRRVVLTRINDVGDKESHAWIRIGQRRWIREHKGAHMAKGDRVNVLVGTTLVVDSATGKLRNHFPGAKYFGLKDEVFAAIEKIFTGALAKMNGLAKPEAVKASKGGGRVDLLVDDTIVVEHGTGKLRNHLPGPKYFGLKDEVFNAIEDIWVEMIAEINGLADLAQASAGGAVAIASPKPRRKR
jgi:hypothetical protein